MRAGRVLMKVCGGAWSKRWDGGAGKGLNLLHDYLYIPVLSCVIYLLSNLFIYVYAVPGRNRICQVKFVWLRVLQVKHGMLFCTHVIKGIEAGRNENLPSLGRWKRFAMWRSLFYTGNYQKWGDTNTNPNQLFHKWWIKHENRLPSMLDVDDLPTHIMNHNQKPGRMTTATSLLLRISSCCLWYLGIIPWHNMPLQHMPLQQQR